MHWALWLLVGIVGAAVLIYLALLFYFMAFGKKAIKTNHQILKLLDDGLLDAFQNDTPYEEVKEQYQKFIDLEKVYQEYVHFATLHEEKKFERQNDCITVQYVKVGTERVARFHFRAFPLKSLPEKANIKEVMIDSFYLVENLLYKNHDIAYAEFITHNRILNESVVKKIIARKNLQLAYTYTDEFETGYLPWIYAEWLIIHGKDNPKSREVYESLRKINRPVDIKFYRKGEFTAE